MLTRYGHRVLWQEPERQPGRQRRSLRSANHQYRNARGTRAGTNLHRLIVNFDTVELFRGLSSASWAAERNGCNATALSIRSIGQEGPLNGSDGLSKILLNSDQILISMLEETNET